MTKLIPVRYNGKNYPPHIKSTIQEVAGNFDKDVIIVNSSYSLHTEYSYMARKFNSKIIKDLTHIISAHQDNVPKLWYNNDWANDFFIFLDRLIASNKPPDVLEIHPPFKDYCSSFEQFLDIYKIFYNKFINKYPNTVILIENRCGTMYKNGKFLLSTCSDVLNLCDVLRKLNVNLKIVLDYPQIFSAELIKMDNINLNKILAFNSELKIYKEVIGGFHIWGKRKSEKGRWAPHTGNFNTFFSNNNDLKKEFLESILNTFDDEIERYFVPEVNSGEEDLLSIVADMENAGFIFNTENSCDLQFIRIKWEKDQPFFELYNRDKNEIIYKNAIGDISLHVTNVKYCLGSYELGTHKHIPCKKNNIVQEKNICKECENLNGFKYCVSCHGDKCIAYKNNAIEYCNKKHFVYLAYFPDQVIKVGTAHELRKEERLLEQGALFRILIAELPTGKLARQMEVEISKLGYKTSVSSKYKIKNILYSMKENEIQELLDTVYQNIRRNINYEFIKYLLDPYIYYDNLQITNAVNNIIMQTEQQQLSLFSDIIKPQYNILTNVSNISGNIIIFIGSIALLKDNKNNLWAYNFKEIYGRNIIFM